MFAQIATSFCRFWLFFFFPVSVEGRQHFPPRGGFILASNHQSLLDPIVLGVLSPRLMNYMARDTLFAKPFFSWILRHVKAFPLKRYSADMGAIKEALRRLKGGDPLLMFPEGARSADGKLGAGLAGVSLLARKAGVPVLPAFIKGTEQALPKGARFLRLAKIRVIFGPLITFSDQEQASHEEATERIMECIAALREASA